MPSTHGTSTPVVVQPGTMLDLEQFQKSTSNGSESDTPSGLEYLAGLNKVFVKQEFSLTKFNGWILDSDCQKIFSAKEELECCTLLCFPEDRPFHMKLKDQNEQEIIHFTRPLVCYHEKLQVESPRGTFIGSVELESSCCSCCNPQFCVKDEGGNVCYHVERRWNSGTDDGMGFQVFHPADPRTPVGKISLATIPCGILWRCPDPNYKFIMEETQ